MKLATLKNGTRDGQLLVVSKELKYAIKVTEPIKTLQAALDDWNNTKPILEEISRSLNAGEATSFALDTTQLASPLPRAYQWADASAYVNHVELVRKARGADMPENFWTDPLIYQGCSDAFLGPCDAIAMADTAWGIDFEAEIAAITGDIAMGITPAQASTEIRLLMLVNDVSLRNLIPNELAKGFGFFQSKPASSFSPVAVTPDELGSAWQDNKVHLPLHTWLNDQLFGQPNAGIDMTFDFATLIAHAAKTRYLTAGSIIGSGTVSNTDRSHGSCCIAEKRMLEILATGKPVTPFMQFGDRVRIEMFDAQGQNIFGTIDQTVQPYRKS